MSEPFALRLRPRNFRDVSILAFDDDFAPRDLSFWGAGIESRVRAGILGFVFELSEFHRHGDLEQGLGHLAVCIPLVYQAGGILNWLHGARFVEEWKRLKLLGVPPENFESEQDAVEGLRTVLKATQLRPVLLQRLAESGVSAAEIATIAGLFEGDIRRIAAGQQEPSDRAVLRISAALDSMGTRKSP